MTDAGRGQAEASPTLALAGVTKQFLGTLALDHVDFDLRSGEIHALLGQNGAGKSTLIKLLAGIFPLTEGQILWRGQPVDPMSAQLPITFIHQDLGLVESMTVAENVAIMAGYPRRLGLIDWRGAASVAKRALAKMDSRIDPETRVADLSAAEKSIVAIARALVRRCDLLVLDEPTAALPAADVVLLLDTLQRLKASGIGLLYVTHRLDEVFRIADRVTVLRDGRRITTCGIAEASPGRLVDWIVGGALAQTEFAPGTPRGPRIPTSSALSRPERPARPGVEAGRERQGRQRSGCQSLPPAANPAIRPTPTRPTPASRPSRTPTPPPAASRPGPRM